MEEMEEREAKEEKERILEKNEVIELLKLKLTYMQNRQLIGCGEGIDSIADSIFR